MRVENRTTIAAPLETIFRLAARVEDWPRILAHYRKVDVLAERPEGRIVTMAAFRAGVPIPVSWKTLQTIDPDSGRVRYRHIGGVTRGMLVEWRLTSGPRGVETTIVHDFAPPWPWPGPWLARAVICGYFVHAIADQTLAGIKIIAEGPAARERPGS
ncbi:MAG TPA: SRPBCC family protein [Chloroflexota bacterium]|nr:SRPBCC family protein [Chloroflexota bacterium]